MPTESGLTVVLPTELVTQVLLELDFFDLVRCMRVCKTFSEIIDDTAQLQRNLYLKATEQSEFFGWRDYSERELMENCGTYNHHPYIFSTMEREEGDRLIYTPNPALMRLTPIIQDLVARGSHWLQMLVSKPSLTEVNPELAYGGFSIRCAGGVRLADLVHHPNKFLYRQLNDTEEEPSAIGEAYISFEVPGCVSENFKYVQSARALASAQPRAGTIGRRVAWDEGEHVWKKVATPLEPSAVDGGERSWQAIMKAAKRAELKNFHERTAGRGWWIEEKAGETKEEEDTSMGLWKSETVAEGGATLVDEANVNALRRSAGLKRTEEVADSSAAPARKRQRVSED